jgi:peroxiredoxin Q/BCP
MALQIGDQAPAFQVKDQSGKNIQLSDYKGHKLAIYFYPKDNTPGCTVQACNLRDNYEMLQNKGIQIVGVSIDSETSHEKFIKKFDLPFPLLADTDKAMVNQFGVWVEKSMYGKTYMGIARTTFLIDENGKIINIIAKVDTKDHTSQIINALQL